MKLLFVALNLALIWACGRILDQTRSTWAFLTAFALMFSALLLTFTLISGGL